MQPTDPNKHIHSITVDEAASDIRSSFPDFTIHKIEPAGQGFTNVAFLVNDLYIFRFAKRVYASSQIEKEAKLLPRLEAYVTAPIPHIEYVGTRQSNGFWFMGYKKIVGATLELELFNQFSADKQRKVTEQIANFISSTHRFPTAEALALGADFADYRLKFTTEFDAAKRLIYPIVSPSSQSYIEQLFRSYLEDDDNFTYVPTFNHAEVSPYHVIVDPESANISGIIDFGDMHVGDPDWDFTYFYLRYGKDYVRQLLEFYDHPDSQRLMRKLNFFASYCELQMIFVGIRESKEVLEDALKWLDRQVNAVM